MIKERLTYIKKKVVYSFPQSELSAALGVFWTSVSVVGVYAVSSLFGVIGGITVSLKKEITTTEIFDVYPFKAKSKYGQHL